MEELQQKSKMDCRFFKGYIPCKYNKLENVECISESGETCKFYNKIDTRILVIKLGAAGDVIRTTPLLSPIRKKYPNSFIYWLTDFPDLVPQFNVNSNGADKILKWEEKSLTFLKSCQFDIIYNLDKDEHACGFINQLKSENKLGYILKNNVPYPASENALHKYMTGLFDRVSQENSKNYLKEIFEVCDFEYKKEEYILPGFIPFDNNMIDKTKKVVGLNTGCGGRWTSRLWPENYWCDLSQKLLNNGYEVVLLGGPEEDEKNKRIAEITNAKYFGTKPLKEFIGLMDKCDIIVSVVTMGMHIAIGLKKKLVLLNNIFNKNEFELFDRGVIIEPEKKCTCYFSPKCKNNEYKCIELIHSGSVKKEIDKLI